MLAARVWEKPHHLDPKEIIQVQVEPAVNTAESTSPDPDALSAQIIPLHMVGDSQSSEGE
jgi:hypothetical protein